MRIHPSTELFGTRCGFLLDKFSTLFPICASSFACGQQGIYVCEKSYMGVVWHGECIFQLHQNRLEQTYGNQFLNVQRKIPVGYLARETGEMNPRGGAGIDGLFFYFTTLACILQQSQTASQHYFISDVTWVFSFLFLPCSKKHKGLWSNT